MPSSLGNGGADQLVRQFNSVHQQVAHLTESIAAVSSLLCRALGTDPDAPSVAIVTSSTSLSRSVDKVAHVLCECLKDLSAMGEAMLPMMQASPEASPALMINLCSTFYRQMAVYYRETAEAFVVHGGLFEKGKAAFSKESQSPSTSLSISTTGGPPLIGLPAASESITTTSNINSAGSTSPVSGRRGAASKRKAEVSKPMTDASTTAPPAAAASTDVQQKSSKTSSRLRAARTKSNGPDNSTPSLTTPAALITVNPELEPTFLLVTASVEEALGSVVLATRPSVFSPTDALLRRAPIATYYIQLVRPGSLADFVVRSFVNASEDEQTDLLCDVLETDFVEELPFACATGEVTVPEDGDLSSLPVCAWRTATGEDPTNLFYTSYALLDWPAPPLDGRSVALVHDSLLSSGGREEVLHVVRLQDRCPQYALVNVYVQSPARGLATYGTKCAAIVSFARSLFARVGFREVPEAVVSVTAQRYDAEQRRGDDQRDFPLLSSPAVDAADVFNPNVQLADLSTPEPNGGGSALTFGDVAKGALRGGMGVLRAGRAVGGAVLDVTGVNGAMRSNMEGNFRKVFPHLANEELLDFYLAAWQVDGSSRQGYLYVTSQWVCFSSGGGTGNTFAIEYDEIKDIRKTKFAKVFDNAIDIHTHVGERFAITGLTQREQTYNLIMRCWLGE